jgi:hypothetical protein
MFAARASAASSAAGARDRDRQGACIRARMRAMKVSRVRATVVKVPDVSPGVLSFDGVERPYCMDGVWKSATAPTPALTVEAALDEQGRVLEIVVIDPQRLWLERVHGWLAQHAPVQSLQRLRRAQVMAMLSALFAVLFAWLALRS